MATTDTTTEPAYEPPAIERRQVVAEALITPSDKVLSAHFEK